MKWICRKTTHAEATGGYTALADTNFGNSRYTGQTPVWEVVDENGEAAGAVYRKRDGVAWAAFLTEIDYRLDKPGCPMMMFTGHLRDIGDYDTIDKIKEV